MDFTPTHVRLPFSVEAWHCPSDDAMWPGWLANAKDRGMCRQRDICEGEWAVRHPDGSVAIYSNEDFQLLYRERQP